MNASSSLEGPETDFIRAAAQVQTEMSSDRNVLRDNEPEAFDGTSCPVASLPFVVCQRYNGANLWFRGRR